MRLLTIGVGNRCAKLVEVLARGCVRVNRVPLLKCFAVLNDLNNFRNLTLDKNRKFFIHNVESGVDGVLNKVLDVYEIFEGVLVITNIGDEFSYEASLEICKKLKKTAEEDVVVLALLPSVADEIVELKGKIRDLERNSDVLILFEEKSGIDRRILEILNLLTLAGEIDLKKKVIGEVVVDTSDIFNALKFNGFSVIGYSKRRVSLLSRIFSRGELKAIRTKRMVDLTVDALNNLSVNGDLKTAKSALLLFAGNPSEITADGLFASISLIESLNKDILIRYGDYPLSWSRIITLILIFSGLKSIKIV